MSPRAPNLIEFQKTTYIYRKEYILRCKRVIFQPKSNENDSLIDYFCKNYGESSKSTIIYSIHSYINHV